MTGVLDRAVAGTLDEPANRRRLSDSDLERDHAVATEWKRAIAVQTPSPTPRAICGSSAMLCAMKIRTEPSPGSACHQLP